MRLGDGQKLVVSRSWLLLSLLHSVPSVPQGVSALSTGSTTVLVTWTEPAVSFRELSHNFNTVIPCVLLRFTVCALLCTYVICILQNSTCLSFFYVFIKQRMTKSNQLPNCSTCAVIPQFNAPPLSAFSS